MGFRPAPKGLPQTSHGYTVDFSRWPQTDLVGSGSFKEFGELATSANATTRIEEGGYIRSVDDTNAQYIGINPNVVGGFNGQGQFSECLCYLDATATQTNYWVGPAVFIGADQQSGVTSGEHHYTLLLNDAGGGTSDWQVYRRSDSLWNALASANGEPDVAGKHFLLRLEAYVLPDNSGVRLKCWKDGKLIIEVVDTNVDRLLGPSTVASHPVYGYPGLSWGNNGIDDPSRWVKWVRGGDLPELSEPKLNLPAIASTPPTIPARKQVGTYDSGGNSVSSATMTLPITATAGNLLVATAAIDKTADWNNPPAGWRRIVPDASNAGVSQQCVYKISDGTEKSVTLTPVSVSRSMSGIIAEYSVVSVLSVTAQNNEGTPTTTCSSGTTVATTVSNALAIAFFSSDSAVNVETGRSYSNSFSEYAFTGTVSAGTPGSNLVDKILTDTGTQETTFTTTDTGDEQLGAVAVFLPAISPALRPFLIERPWTRQPPPGTRIDNSNPLAKNLTRFVTFYMGGVGYDVFNNEQPIPNTAYQGVIGTLEGTASSHPLTTGSAELEMVERPRYETGMQTSGFTFMSKARNKVDGALANQEFVAGMFGGGAGGNSWAWRLTVSGTPTFTIYTDGGTTNNSSAPLPTGYDARDWHTFGGIMDYPNSTCYVDYTPDSTPTDLTGLTVDDHSAGAAMHIGAGGSATSSWNGEILYCATWKRALSQAEWDSMVANPWQIFEPQKVWVAISVDAVANVVITVVDTDNAWDDGDTGLVITGTGFI